MSTWRCARWGANGLLVVCAVQLNQPVASAAPFADRTFFGEQAGEQFGHTVAGIRDITGDRKDDVVIAAPYYDAEGGEERIGRAEVFNANTGASIYEVEGANGGIGANLGYLGGVECAGDVNNDGTIDVIVGEPLTFDDDIPAVRTGVARIFSGDTNSSGDPVELFTFYGEDFGDKFGWAVAGIGDLDGDGYDDVMVGAPWADGTAGRVYIFLGEDADEQNHIVRDAEDADYIITGDAIDFNTSDHLGYALHSAGFFNDTSSGTPDIVIAGPYWGDTQFFFGWGRVYIFYGDELLNTTPGTPAARALTTADADVTVEGDHEAAYNGYAVGGGGDFNNDGFDDVIFSAYAWGDDKGQVYIVFGGTNVATTMDVTAADVIITGDNNGDLFGNDVAFAGNVEQALPLFAGSPVNDDVIIGAPGHGADKGRAYVFYGSRGAGTYNASDADIIQDGPKDNSRFGISADSAGYFNSDRKQDLLVGAPGYDTPLDTDIGRAYVFFAP